MKNRELISPGQMSALFLSFSLGSSIVYIPKSLIEAGKNASALSLLLSAGIGVLLLTCILYFHRHNSQITMIQYFQHLCGKWITAVIAIPFIVALFLMLPLIVQGLGGFFTSTMMTGTPMYIFHAFIFLAAALTVHAGIEVMARMFVLLLLIILATTLFVLVFAIPLYHPTTLFPIFPDGIKPLFHGSYVVFGFPNGGVALFIMLLCFAHTDKTKTLNKQMYKAFVIFTLTLIVVTLCTIMVFGNAAGVRKFSLYEIARVIEITGIFERIESVVGITLIAGSYMKTSIVLLILNLGITQLLNIKDDRMLIFPISIIALFLSVTMYPTEFAFTETFTLIWPLMVTVGFVLPALLAMLLTFIRKRMGKQT